MKSVVAAAVILFTVVGLCILLSAKTNSRIDALYAMTESLPIKEESYREDIGKKTEAVGKIADVWADDVSYFSYVCGHTALNRADEAVWNLYASVISGDYVTAIAARYQLLDALRRMRELEHISLSSIF